MPLLVLTGESDDVVRLGFDITCRKKKRTLRILPLIGPKAALPHGELSAREAEALPVAFLEERIARSVP